MRGACENRKRQAKVLALALAGPASAHAAHLCVTLRGRRRRHRSAGGGVQTRAETNQDNVRTAGYHSASTRVCRHDTTLYTDPKQTRQHHQRKTAAANLYLVFDHARGQCPRAGAGTDSTQPPQCLRRAPRARPIAPRRAASAVAERRERFVKVSARDEHRGAALGRLGPNRRTPAQ